jgi:hypothetical protein
MNRTALAIVIGALFSIGAAAQTQTGSQAGAQGSGQASVEAGKTQGQASGSAAAASSASAQNGQANAALASGSAINAELTSPVDSKKAKAGDPVSAKTTEAVKSDGKTVIPKGTKLVGHVTQASARAKGESESALGIAFDKAVLKGGQEVPLNVAIQALASAQGSTAGVASEADAMGGSGVSAGGAGMSGGRSAVGGVTSAAGNTVGTVTNTAGGVANTAGGAVNSTTSAAGNAAATSKGAIGGLNSSGQFTTNSQGVFGLNGLNLSSAASNATQGSVITSTGKNVHLESGTRMLLVSQAAAGGEGQGGTKPPETKEQQPKGQSQPNKPVKE